MTSLPPQSCAIVRLTDPHGRVAYLCYGAPGVTPDPAGATRFATDRAAWRAANASLYGEPDAFWNSERAGAVATRLKMRGWLASIEATPDA